METTDKRDELTALFRKLGAPDPDSWARSQLEEGIPQIYRFLWLREAWKRIVQDDDDSWMDAAIKQAEARPDDPYSGVGLALKRCLAQGVDREALNQIVRGQQAEFLFSLCYLLDDPGLPEKEVADLEWGLFAVDENGRPIARIQGLHESVLETDPTGREMRPKTIP